MAFLTVNGTNVPVDARSTPARKKDPIGDSGRAIDGTMRWTILGYKRTWVVETILQDLATTEALETAVLSTQPCTVTGDLLNNVNTTCFIQVTDRKATAKAGNHVAMLQITIMEQ